MEANLGPFPFVFLPGQYATITSEIDGQKVRRSYTISSAPTQREYIELTVKREQHGLESRHLHDHAKTGDLLEITAPSGKFFFTGAEAKGIVLIAGGVGITPMMSVLRDLTDRSYEHRVHLICAANSPQDLIFREEIAYLAAPSKCYDRLDRVEGGWDGLDGSGRVHHTRFHRQMRAGHCGTPGSSLRTAGNDGCGQICAGPTQSPARSNQDGRLCAAKGRSGSRGRTGRADAGKRSRCGTDRSWRRSG
jgi:ferredoxin-NADP reductase